MMTQMFHETHEILRMSREKLPKPTVLVVDDEPLIRWSLSEGLTESGCPVRQASSGSEARAALRALTNSPLVIVLDLRLPDVTDLSLLAELRKLRPDAPVIMMSAHGTSEQARAAAALGAYKFVDKPFDVTVMVALVDSAWAETHH